MRLLPIAFALLCVIATSTIAGPIFDAAYILGHPGSPRGTRFVDLNKDGVDDLVAGLANTAGVAVAMGTGAGTYAPFRGMFPNRIDVLVDPGDVDGDGWPDVAFLAYYNTPDSAHVGALYGDGSGAFVDSFEVRTPAPAWQAYTHDLDGDGRSDIVVGLKDSTIAVYHSNANRTLTLIGTYPALTIPHGIAFGQLVGSPAVDVLVSSGEYDGVSVFEGNGDGTLGARTDIPLSGSGYVAVLAPLDGQPGLDLVLGFSGVGYAPGIPGGFGPLTSMPDGIGGYGLVATDVDRDGDLDVASGMVGNQRGIQVWLNDGLGNFGPRRRTGRTVLAPGDLDVGNVDGDGIPDMVWDGSFTSECVVFRGKGDGTFGPDPIAPQVPGTIVGLASGDFDNDGLLDAVGANTQSSVLAFAKGHGNGTFTNFVNSATSRAWFRLSAGRFDSDSNLDLVGISGNSSFAAFLRGHGDGTFDPAVEFALPGNGASITKIDLNADGRDDIVVPCPTANALAVLMQGPAGLLAPVASPTPAGPTCVSYADLNGDSRLDRVLACTNQMAVQLDDGVGGWNTVHLHPLTPTPNQLELGDLDEDGFPDVALTQGVGTTLPPALLHVLKGHPGGTFDSDAIADLDWSQVQPPGQFPSANMVFIRDLDGDGHLDLVAKDGGNFSFAIVARGRGDRTFRWPEAYGMPLSSANLVLADFDGDGRLDAMGSGSNNSTPITSMTFLRNISNGIVDVPLPGRTPVAGLALSPFAPNPGRGAIAAVLTSPSSGSARLALYSASGRVVASRGEVPIVAGSNRVTFDVSGIAPGLYWLRATRGQAVAVRKVVVAR